MNALGQRVAKNASVLMVGQLITWGLAILLTIFMPRFLGPAAIGNFQLASSIWAIMTIFVTFGMDTLLTKEIARSPDKIDQLFGTSVVLRAILFVFGLIAVGVYTSLLGYSTQTIILVFIVGIANIFVQLTSACQATLQGLERMEYVSLSDIVSKTFITFATLALLFLGYGVIPVALVLIGGGIASSMIQFISLNRLHPIKLKPDWSIAIWMIKASFPYLLIVGIRTVYVQIDVVIISLLVSEVVLGWYSVASRLFSTLLFIPTVLMMAVFPAMSRMHTVSSDILQKIMRKNFDLMLIFGIPIGIGLFVIADPLVILLFGPAFAGSGPVLAIMGLVLILTYQNMLLGQFLISTDRQAIWTRVMAVATLITVPLDLVFIPLCQKMFHNGAIGGSLSFLVTESVITIGGMWLLPKGTLRSANLWTATRVIIAGLVMGGLTWITRDIFILVPIAVGAITYTSLIIGLRVITKEDWAFFMHIAQSTSARFHKTKPEPSGIGGEL